MNEDKTLKDLLVEADVQLMQTEIPAGKTKMRNDCTTGKAGEKIFEEYLRNNNFKYNNVTRQHKTDFIVNGTVYEVKANYKDNDILIIETVSDDGILSGTGQLKRGWWYTSTANYFVFISLATHVLIQVPNNEETKELFREIRSKYAERKNKNSFDDNGNEWQSWHIPVPLKEFEGYYEYLN